MKRWMIAAAAAMFLLLTACGLFPDPEAAAPEQHTLYYLAAEDASYHGDQGALACEMRTLHDIDDPKQVLLQYLAGPESSETCSPFPVQLELLDVKLEDGRKCRIEVDMSEWPKLINGIPEEECFDGILYAG